jgi:putative FmdB family regulatory protein
MPIYEYECKECSDYFELLVPRPTDDPQPCPKCGSGNTEKLLSLTSSIISCGIPDLADPTTLNMSNFGAKSPKGGGGCGGMGGGMGGGCPMSGM